MDCNAVNPSTLDRIRAAIGQDEHFLDTCIIGSPPKPGGGVVKVTGFTDAQGDTPARNRRSTRQGRATPLMRPSVSACKPAG
jgi:hypothetical protein